ncbi:STAS domain-containing protein [Bailinhaonella thermotolerans]|uniref:Anti-sigma factor antagonist n=1 Tax=Bailinhaonella thermotolerans TaxID=1070861 RepID=A0A3A4A5S9_9ACTN|nr:STAS domain-containing protein [Bailinhaonella thermotolerans]RJL24246.1 anti-sigma factor antagonist [Bailinhaonella thermotolerans]
MSGDKSLGDGHRPERIADAFTRPLYDDGRLRVVPVNGMSPPRVRVIGEIDITNSVALAKVLRQARGDRAVVIADVSEISFSDVSGLRVLALPALPPSRRWIRLAAVPPHLVRLLHMIGWPTDPGASPAPPYG